MEKVIKYKCAYCGNLLGTEEECIKHEDRHKRIEKANEMLEAGFTLKEIQNACNIWRLLPEYLENVNKDNCFIISYWQGCNKAAYKIDTIYFNGNVRVWGCGSWNGYYGNECYITSNVLKNPRPKDELFIDPRYEKRLKEKW